MSLRRNRTADGVVKKAYRDGRHETDRSVWYRFNGTIRFYGLVFLVSTKLADVITTAVGLRYLPAIAEANPIADHLFAQWGLFTGLTVLGFTSIFFATITAELFGLEVRRRLGLSKTALFAQASIYATLSLLFGIVAIQNGLLIANQVLYTLGGTIGLGG